MSEEAKKAVEDIEGAVTPEVQAQDETPKPGKTGEVYVAVADYGDKTEDVRGTKVGLVTQAGREMADSKPSAWFSKSKAGTSWEGPVVRMDGGDVKLRGGTSKNVFRRDAGIAKLEPEGGGEPVYATYFKLRIAAVIAAILAALVAAFLIAALCYRVPPQDMAVIFADTIGITHNNEDAHANIEGTTSFQSPISSDTHWKAGTMSQHFVMANPDGNTVALAPHVYVDINGDGNFAEDECVYNPIQYASDKTVISYGEFIPVGQQLENIEIDRPLDAGSYKAKVLYTAVDVETKTLCNGNEFVFDLEVA